MKSNLWSGAGNWTYSGIPGNTPSQDVVFSDSATTKAVALTNANTSMRQMFAFGIGDYSISASGIIAESVFRAGVVRLESAPPLWKGPVSCLNKNNRAGTGSRAPVAETFFRNSSLITLPMIRPSLTKDRYPGRTSYASRFWRSITSAAVALAGLISSAEAQQNTYGEIPMDAGGWVSGFAQHSSGRLYGYGDIFGLYRSDDFGATWTFLQNKMTDASTFVSGVAVSPTNADRVAFTAGKDVWTSTNAGADWTKRLSDRQGGLERGSKPLAYHPTVQDELWLTSAREGQTGTLWRSTNNGASWNSVGGTPFVNERAKTIHIFPTAPNEIWVGTSAIEGKSTTGGLWCSADSGANWRKVWNNNGNETVYYGAPGVSSIARNASRVSLFSTNTGVWQVTATDWNNTQTYSVRQSTFANQNIPNVTALADGTFWTAEMGDQDWAPKISPDGVTWTNQPAVMTAAYVPEWSSAEFLSKPGTRVYGRDMLVQDVNNPARWLLTGGSSAQLSEDSGKTWRLQPGGMAGIPTYRVNFDRTNPGRAYVSSSDRGVFVVDDGGFSGRTAKCSNSTFHELHTFHETMASANGNIIVGAGVNQGINRTVIVRSEDGGTTWNRVTTAGLPDNSEGVTKAVMSLNDPNDFLVLLGSGKSPNNPGLYRTQDGGANFSPVGVGSISFDGVDTGMRYHPENAFLERDGVNANIRYLALRGYPGNSAPRGVWRSLDGGTTWERRAEDVMGNGWEGLVGFSVDPTIEGRLWAIGGSLRRSDNGGANWVTVGDFTNGTSGAYVNAYGGRVALIGKRPGDTYKKVYYSEDDGANWREMTDADHRMSWASNVTVDPWRPGQLWVGGSRSIQIINPPVRVATPTFSLAGGTYTSAQSVTISTTTTGATIRYTTNGTDPTSSSTVASGAITISATTTLKARAFRLGHPDSAVATATYTIGSTTLRDPENPANTVAGVNYDFHQFTTGLNNTDGLTSVNKVSSGTWTGLLSAVPGQDADSDDTNYGLVYTGYINVPTDGTYTFYTNSDDGNKLQIGSTTVASDEAPHGPRWNENSVAIGLKAGKHAFTLKYYENAGGDSLNVEYSGPGIARTGLPASALYRVGSTPTVATPTFNPAAGTYTSAQSVTISTATSGATIRYTTDGSNPTSSSPVANGAIIVSATTTLKAKAFLSGANDSAVATGTYTLQTGLQSFRITHSLAADGSQDLLAPARDDVENILKFAFNMIGNGTGQASNLTTPNSQTLAINGAAGLPLVGRDANGRLTVTYIRRKASSNPGISYAVEYSNSLSAWTTNASATESTTSIDSTFERVTVTDSASPVKRFARVKVVAL